jgi:hypothetical protein
MTVSHSGVASASLPGTTAWRSRAIRSCRLVTGSSPPSSAASFLAQESVLISGTVKTGQGALRSTYWLTAPNTFDIP